MCTYQTCMDNSTIKQDGYQLVAIPMKNRFKADLKTNTCP